MFVIDDVTLIVGVAVLVIGLALPFVNVLMSRFEEETPENSDGDDAQKPEGGEAVAEHREPGISVVLTVDDDGEQLMRNLPMWLGQEYDGDFQVVVVVSSNDDLTENTLKKYSADKHLYSTFIPASSRYMSRRKLAITVGVKAAKYDWILLTDVDCMPNTPDCLATLAGKCAAGVDIVMGYSNFCDDYTSSRRFDHVYTLYRQMAKAQKGMAWGYCGNALLYRKEMFLGGKGFDGNLKYIRGEYDFIVNKYSTDDNTVIATSPASMVQEEDLSDKGWRNKNLFYMSTRKSLGRTAMPRFLFNATMWTMWITYLAEIGAIAYSVLAQEWILTAVAAVSLVVTLVLRAFVMARSIRKFLAGMSFAKMLWLEATMPFRNFVRIVRFKMTDKYDFISHKI